MRLPILLAAASVALAAPAAAQRQPTPEQRIERLERQVRQVQGRVFPQGRPADTAGFVNDPAASQTVVVALSNRIDNLERQLAELIRVNGENNSRIVALETEIRRLQSDQDQRIRALEAAPADRAGPATASGGGSTTPARPAPTGTTASASTGNFEADGEAAYDVGYQLWTQKKYEQAITALRAMSSAFPGHRRVSWANNLAGRALLDSGQPRAAAEALLANYRGNPKGERAPDSLFYLGQALVALKQPAQACKAYAELEEVYGSKVRADLKALLPGAKSRAGCR